jgi:hypothetical protein
MNREEAINVVKCNWPEGQHLLSEALKPLIPEFQESEDERIRKEIIESIKGNMSVVHKEQCLAYLERQKEYIDDIRQYAYNKGLVDAEEKQKPLSTEETELNSIAFLEQLGYTCVPPGAEKRPAEWSEEDERVIHDAHCWLDEYAGFLVSANKDKAKMLWKLSEKLKSLRPQPKQGWSKENEGLIDLAVAAVEDFYDKKNPIRVEIINFLHSLRPQPHWKPSEYHLQGMRRAIIKAEKGSDAWNSLTDLYEHLKNL